MLHVVLKLISELCDKAGHRPSKSLSKHISYSPLSFYSPQAIEPNQHIHHLNLFVTIKPNRTFTARRTLQIHHKNAVLVNASTIQVCSSITTKPYPKRTCTKTHNQNTFYFCRQALSLSLPDMTFTLALDLIPPA